MARTKTKTLYTVRTAYFTDHDHDHQGWNGKGWYWYIDAEGCDELYGPYDTKTDAVEVALKDAGFVARIALQDGPAASVKAD